MGEAEADLVSIAPRMQQQFPVENARKQSGNWDIDGVRGGAVQLEQLQLATTDGTPLQLAAYVSALSVAVDNKMVLDRVQPLELQSDQEVSHALPDSLASARRIRIRTALTTLPT